MVRHSRFRKSYSTAASHEPEFARERVPFFGASRACESEENSSKNVSILCRMGTQKYGRPAGMGAIVDTLIRRVCFQSEVRSIRIDAKAAAGTVEQFWKLWKDSPR